MTQPRILVVEDDHGLRAVLARGLRTEGFTVLTAADGGAALAAAKTQLDAVVMDIGLPDSDGRDVCQAMRARGVDVPIVFLTARQSSVDLLAGFAAGADDYMIKPFQLSELVARLRALLRRRPLPASCDAGGLYVDPLGHRLVDAGNSVRLAPTEFRLLGCLVSKGGVVRRDELRAAAWPPGAIVSENTLDQYVAKLRRRIAEVGSSARIEVVRGVGYELR
ncbi:MAG TPA: response regulator transcription factor [Jatrophihabitans sp.]